MDYIYIHYHDIDEQGPRGGCGFFTVKRCVTDIQEVEGGEQGTIMYKHAPLVVYRRAGSRGWTSDVRTLGPIQATYVL